MTTPSTTLTAAREAERAAHEAAAAATKHREQVEKDMEQEKRRPTVEYCGLSYRLRADGHVQCEESGLIYPVGFILALASLLPRKPVEVTNDMVDKAEGARLDATAGLYMRNDRAMRAALEAVASDLSAPAAVAAPTLGTPQGGPVAYQVLSRGYLPRLSLARARAEVPKLDVYYPIHAPHAVYALHEVSVLTEEKATC